MSRDLQSLVSQQLQKAILKAFPTTNDLLDSLHEVSASTQENFGDYQCNSSMKLAKSLQMSPRAVAEAIINATEKNLDGNPFLNELSVAGPGFINIRLDDSFIVNRSEEQLLDERLAIAPVKLPQRVIIDFSSPNIAKEMHVGHLRSTIIGDCLSRLFEFLGHDVLRLNHIGDWGTSFGMLIAYMREYEPDVLSARQECSLTDLVGWYRASKLRFDEDPLFKKRAQEQVVALQGGDLAALKAWTLICDISQKAYKQIYDLLEVKLIDRGESFYNDNLAPTVADLEAKGLVVVHDGAKCIYLEGYQNREGEPLPLIIQKQDGGYNYATTDLAALRHRVEVEKGQRLIYITDAGQATHFAMVFKAAERAGYYDSEKVSIEHIPFGLVLGGDGKKFRTRSGQTERLIDLLETAIAEADQILLERKVNLDATERLQLAAILGLGAVKYADLSCHRMSNYSFSYEKMLRFEGNTAAFLLYSYVRAQSIKKRIKGDIELLLKSKQKIILSHPSERALLLHILRMHERLLLVAKELTPNRLCDYLYLLAEKFNGFFRDCRVEGAQEQESRLLICDLFAKAMRLGLHLLGVKTTEKM